MADPQTAGGSAADPWPKHHQVYLVLLQDIQEGRYAPPKTLPSELELARQFSVSRITIRRAMERLDAEGLIERHRGRGTFVRPSHRTAPVQASISGNIENLIAMGLETEVRVVSVEHVAAPPDVAARLELPVGAMVQKAVRIRSLGATPFSHLTTYVPEDIGRTFGAKELAVSPLLVLLEKAGARIARAQQVITATLATPDVATLLGVQAGSALLNIRRAVYDQDGRPVEYINGLYRPDTYEHEMSFTRQSGDGAAVWNISGRR